jgi:hypothetical protein
MGYTKTTWVTGDTITAAKLNNVETELELLDGLTGTLQKDLTCQANVTANDIVEYINGGIRKKTTCSSLGTETAVNSAAVNDISIVYISEEKAMILYSEGANLYAVIATTSGTTINLGTPLAVATDLHNAGGVLGQCCLIDTNKVLCCYMQVTSTKMVAIVLSVSDTTISKGSGVASSFTMANYNIPMIKLSTDKALVTYADSSNCDAVVINVSDTTPTFGTALNGFHASVVNQNSLVLINTSKAIVSVGNNLVTFYVLSVDGSDAVTAGSAFTMENSNSGTHSLIKIADNTALVSYTVTTSNIIRVAKLSAASTTITASNYNEINRGIYTTGYTKLTKINDDRYVLSVATATALLNVICIFEYSGDTVRVLKELKSINLGTASTLHSIAYIGKDKSIEIYKGTSNYAYAKVIPTPYYKNVIGITTETATAGNDAAVITKGVVTGLTGLTEGSMYYLQDDGSYATTPTEYKLGVALSTTSLQLDPYSVL